MLQEGTQEIPQQKDNFPHTGDSTIEDSNEGDRALGKLQAAAKALDEEKEKNDPAGKVDSWISKKSFSLMRKKAKRVGLREAAQRVGEQLNESLEDDRKRRYAKTAKELESKLDEGDVRGAYKQAQRWYRKKNQASKPTYQDEEETRKELEQLHTAIAPAGEEIPTHISPVPAIYDNPPEEEEICRTVLTLHSRKAGGVTGIRVEHIKEWMIGATDEENPRYVEEWKLVMKLVRYCFENDAKNMPRAFEVGILALIPKDITSHRGIVLLEAIYKIASAIVASRLSNAVKFHDALHGFLSGRRTGTVITQVKLRMQHTRNCGVGNLYMIFLDLKKAYYSLDRDRTLSILKGYGVGDNILRFLKEVWGKEVLVSKQDGFFGKPFDVGRGVRCGDISSSIIFNIAVDAVIRDIEATGEFNFEELLEIFYADDGAIVDEDPIKVQALADAFTERFARVGLHMNETK